MSIIIVIAKTKITSFQRTKLCAVFDSPMLIIQRNDSDKPYGHH